jgi:hypothetical protein
LQQSAQTEIPSNDRFQEGAIAGMGEAETDTRVQLQLREQKKIKCWPQSEASMRQAAG